MNDEKFILVEKLQEGFDLATNQMDLLLTAAEKLIDKNMYSMAIPLTILAREELAKLGLIQQHISGRKPIRKKQWAKFTGYGAHIKKLLILIDSKKEFAKKGRENYEGIMALGEKLGFESIKTSYEEMIKISPSVEANLKLLNLIKQDCWYLDFDWKLNDWRIITKTFTKNQLESTARAHLTGMRLLYYHYMFLNRHTRLLLYGTNKTIQMERDSYRIKVREKAKELKSPKFSKLNILAKSLLIKYEKMMATNHTPKSNKENNVP